MTDHREDESDDWFPSQPQPWIGEMVKGMKGDWEFVSPEMRPNAMVVVKVFYTQSALERSEMSIKPFPYSGGFMPLTDEDQLRLGYAYSLKSHLEVPDLPPLPPTSNLVAQAGDEDSMYGESVNEPDSMYGDSLNEEDSMYKVESDDKDDLQKEAEVLKDDVPYSRPDVFLADILAVPIFSDDISLPEFLRFLSAGEHAELYEGNFTWKKIPQGAKLSAVSDLPKLRLGPEAAADQRAIRSFLLAEPIECPTLQAEGVREKERRWAMASAMRMRSLLLNDSPRCFEKDVDVRPYPLGLADTLDLGVEVLTASASATEYSPLAQETNVAALDGFLLTGRLKVIELAAIIKDDEKDSKPFVSALRHQPRQSVDRSELEGCWSDEAPLPPTALYGDLEEDLTPAGPSVLNEWTRSRPRERRRAASLSPGGTMAACRALFPDGGPRCICRQHSSDPQRILVPSAERLARSPFPPLSHGYRRAVHRARGRAVAAGAPGQPVDARQMKALLHRTALLLLGRNHVEGSQVTNLVGPVPLPAGSPPPSPPSSPPATAPRRPAANRGLIERSRSSSSGPPPLLPHTRPRTAAGRPPPLGAAGSDGDMAKDLALMSQLFGGGDGQQKKSSQDFLVDMILESMTGEDPMMQSLMESNPEFKEIFQDKDFLREHIQAMTNPQMKKEMTRTTDRQIANLNSIPGAFTQLTKLHHEVRKSEMAEKVPVPGGPPKELVNDSPGINRSPVNNPFGDRRAAMFLPVALDGSNSDEEFDTMFDSDPEDGIGDGPLSSSELGE